jgi:hypothetical protein
MPTIPYSCHTTHLNFIEPGLPQRVIENNFKLSYTNKLNSQNRGVKMAYRVESIFIETCF